MITLEEAGALARTACDGRSGLVGNPCRPGVRDRLVRPAGDETPPEERARAVPPGGVS